MLHALSILAALILLSSCGRSQEHGGSLADTTSTTPPVDRTALKESLEADLQRAQQRFAAIDPDDPAERLIAGTRAALVSLSVTARALDANGEYAKEIDEELRSTLHQDSVATGTAARIMNGMVGLYTMYGIMYRMRFSTDDSRMSAFEAANTEIQQKLTSAREPILPAALMSERIYALTRDIMLSFDRDSLYVPAFQTIDQQFDEGRRVAENEEHRFLNGMYRAYEISQLWLLFLDPSARSEITDLNRKFGTSVGGNDDIGRLMAVSVDFLSRINSMIARKTLQNNL